MTEQKKKMENCFHAWIYDNTEHETVYMRCPYCNMLRMAMPGEPVHLVSKELRIRYDDKDGDI